MKTQFYLPVELQRAINEYAKPLTRRDYRKGSYMMRVFSSHELIVPSVFRMYIECCFSSLDVIKLYASVLNEEM